MKRLTISLLFTGLVALGASACGGAAEEIEDIYDCAQICEAYGDCVQEAGMEYDEVACIDQCENKADAEPGFREQANTCQQCIEDTKNVCVEKAFQCADECATVVLEASQ